ncbi:hypothetical protein ACFFVA_02225 [Arthrobacter psychrochitiniphilus]
MVSFAAGEINVPVATTVIEVGVDVRNATLCSRQTHCRKRFSMNEGMRCEDVVRDHGRH